MTNPPKKPKEGRPSVFAEELGLGKGRTYYFPHPVHALLRLKAVRLLLNWMALDDSFRDEILDKVPGASSDPEYMAKKSQKIDQ